MATSVIEYGRESPVVRKRRTWTVLGMITLYTVAVVGLTTAFNRTSELATSIKALKEVVTGPTIIEKTIRSEDVGVSTGGSSDARQAYTKKTERCVYPQNGGKLVPGKGGFVMGLNNADGKVVGWEPIKGRDTEFEYCVRMWAGTGAKEDQRYIYGYVTALERFQQR